MNDSVKLLSSMSPKIRNKLKPGEIQFRRVTGASILALKKNIRRSLIYDKAVTTTDNENLNIVDSLDGTESLETGESSVTNEIDLKYKTKVVNEDDSIIVLSDSASSSNSITDNEEPKQCRTLFTSDDTKTESQCILPKDKLDAISNWVANVQRENDTTSYSTYSELSTIYGDNIGNDCIPKKVCHAVNSTFSKGSNKKFDELFIKKLSPKVNETVSVDGDIVDESMKQLVIEDSFEIINTSLKTRVRGTGDLKKKVEENVEKLDESIGNDFVMVNNQLDVAETADNSVMDETSAANFLDELYGDSWRANKDLILSKTEPRKNIKKPSIKTTATFSERKPKQSLIYKNPYLDSERSKSQQVLNNLSTSRLKENVKSPWLQRLKVLCDSDTNSENSPKRVPPIRLEFDDSGDEDAGNSKTSKYFKNKTKSKKDVSNKENRYLHIDKNKNQSDSRSSTSSTNIKSVNNSGSSSSNSFEKVQHITKRKSVNKNANIEIDADDMVIYRRSSEEITDNININVKSNVKLTVRQNQHTDDSSTSSIDSNVNGIKTKKINKKRVPKISSSSGSSSSDSSNEEWNKEISKIERSLNDNSYSFLASLSASVPLTKCDMSARIFRNNFKTYKDQLLKKLFKLYNEKVFDNVLPQDMLIEWNDRMRSSAGFCYCKKITRRTGKIERSARIALSTKVLDTADRLRDTLIHELCHAATWIVNCVSDGHGDYWKSWAIKAMKTFPELPNIKRCHNFVINTKYTYRCVGCGYSIGRHSKSLDIERKRCGYCYGKFEILINKINKNGETKSVAATPKKEATGFALFVKENYGIHKLPNRKHGDVMKILGQKFQEMKVDNKC